MHDIQTIHTHELQPHPHINFNQLYHDFIDFIDVSKNTQATYTRAIRQFLRYLIKHDIRQPQRSDILAYRDELKADGKKSTTIQSYIIALRQFFNWLEAQGAYPNIAKGIKGAKVTKGHKKDYLTSAQVADVLNNVDRSTPKGLRDYAILAVMFTGGLRTIEVSRANIEDLRTLGNSTVLYVQGKGRDDKTEYMKVIPEVEKAIRLYLKTRTKDTLKPDSPLFASTSNNNAGKTMTTRSIRTIVKGALINAGYDSDRLTAHSTRHTAGTLNLLNGGTLEETQQLLRHENISTTMIYLHHLERENNDSEHRIGGAIFK
ncbi:tyrosine-type recombinase/integrase [Fundicoccus sp. Sow4_H7]|uniref:tyrosine-type recombinase/integrase n=1 Tax=Fundicoccus sp. Sow4_H7 TaxID=3438784 RepID=UPI003F93950C